MSGGEQDYYALIGVDKSATLHEIRSKFRAKVLQEHPDKGGDPKMFQMLNKAYNVLTDAEKRKRYDSTGKADKSAEDEFIDGFNGGRLRFEPREKAADSQAIVSLEDRIITGQPSHQEGFEAWLRMRDQNAMVLTDQDFLKTHLFNSAELATEMAHKTPVHHVLGAPKTDAYGQPLAGAVQPQAKPRALKKTLEHDEVVVRMLSVPVDDAMLYPDLKKSGVCLGNFGIGRIEQVGSRIDDFKAEDPVLVMPKPAKYSLEKPIGTARTLLPCSKDDVIKVPQGIMEELTPEQIAMTPIIAASYQILEIYATKLKPGDSVLLNGPHLGCAGTSMLQLCKLLKLKPLCIVSLAGFPRNLAKGEWGTKQAWQDVDVASMATPQARMHYERISETLHELGAEEVFPDAVALLRWRDRNQRMLPKLALDGIASGDSAEQLIHCLQSGDKDAQVVLYGPGNAQPLDIPPALLAAWGGRIHGFSFPRWVRSQPTNSKKMFAVMDNVTKLVRTNKFTLDTVLYKVGEDAISEAFSRGSDLTDSAQVVLIFPTLEEEVHASKEDSRKEQERAQKAQEEMARKQEEEAERTKLMADWLDMLFTDQSIAMKHPEDPLPVNFEGGALRSPRKLVAFIGDSPKSDSLVLQEIATQLPDGTALMSFAWSNSQGGEAFSAFNLKMPEVADGSWYLREPAVFENSDLDLLHEMELLSRALVDSLEPKFYEFGLKWEDVILVGFGKGAGVALYAQLMHVIPKNVRSMILFSPVIPFPLWMLEKAKALPAPPVSTPLNLFTVWGNRNRSTPGNYRQLLATTMRKLPSQVHVTPDTMPDGDHTFDNRCLPTLLQLVHLKLR